MRLFPLSKPLRLGDILVESNLISEEDCASALKVQAKTGRKLGRVLIEQGLIDEETLVQVLSSQTVTPYVKLRAELFDKKISAIIPRAKAEYFSVIPLFKIRNRLFVGISDPNALNVLDELQHISSLEVYPVICLKKDIEKFLPEAYSEDDSIPDYLSEFDETEIEIVEIPDDDLGHIEDMSEASPIINLVNMIIMKAIKEHASDVHIEPGRDKCRVRFRIDGVMYEVITLKSELHPAIISRLKVMSNLDIAERRMPQDGRIQVNLEKRTVDLRFSSLPGIIGEKVVLRVLDKKTAILDINRLGIQAGTLSKIKQFLQRPYGLILVTGPTGSGKTTTLYSALNYLNTVEKNIVTIEDPVEYHLDIINQNQVREPIGLTFAKILKHTLRQDPDIIMVGEIRDRETAEIAVQAALTGHLVLSTLHTNDSASTISRLIDMGIDSYLIATSLVAVVAQRLVRTVCPHCAYTFFPDPVTIKQYGWEKDSGLQLAAGKGCPKCFDSGFSGRAGVYEVLEMERSLQRLTLNSPSGEVIKGWMKEHDVTTLFQEGVRMVKQQRTTFKEVMKSVYSDNDV